MNAICINDKEYRTLIESKTQKDKNEMNSIKRYILTNTFDRPYDDNLDIEWVKHNIDYYNGYKYFKLFKDDNDINTSIEKCKKIISSIRQEENKKEHKSLLINKSPSLSSSSEDEDDKKTPSPYKKKTITKKIHSKIHYDKTFYKIYHCLYFIKESGFKSLNDIDKIKIDYKGLHRYCREHEGEIRAVFERSKIMVWSDNNGLSPNEKNALSKYVNQKLESMFSIRISKDINKGSCVYYKINQLFSI